ncbi:EAL domain-containing protein [Frankia sp. AgKG'84/4]|uniref:EAL domain-containing protein n=1 Tax=Frankia sp. AgKG'84/4 TaxID=573490 RepID=UPI00200E9CFC|nr:EAL domain-containing protein [Frankia sp. AgKG'84/4]MCL9795205.1 EAL domain-containing protein [Frankia sp. AgKG'84/4]
MIVGTNACGSGARLPLLRHAETDSQAIYDALTDEKSGTFDAADVHLLLGPAATTRKMKESLRSAALDMTPSDILFVYFAGHAVMSRWQHQSDPYLVTSDLDLNSLREDPDGGVRMSFLWRDVFHVAAGSSFLILDCCHAGAYLTTGGADPVRLRQELPQAIEEAHEGHRPARHSALFACAANQVARENDDLRGGVVTHHVLRALQGKAADARGGVTFGSLVEYVRAQDIEPEPGCVVQGWGPATVLTRPAFGTGEATGNTRPEPRPVAATSITACRNPMESELGLIEKLLERAFRSAGGPTRPDGSDRHAALGVLRHAFDASAVLELKLSGAESVIVGSAGDLSQETLSEAFPVVASVVRQDRSVLGHVITPASGPRLLVVPLTSTDTEAMSALVVVDPAPAFLDIGEPLVVIASTMLTRWSPRDLLKAEVDVLTALRAEFGRLPLRLYRQGLSAYSRLLESLVMVFEPVMILSDRANTVGIQSWEALARTDSKARRAPLDVLSIPDVWGDEFLIERDKSLATKAIHSYALAHSRGPWGNDAPKPVSINVSVRALLSAAYAHGLADAIREAGLAQYAVTLEISERDPIEPRSDEWDRWKPNPSAYFQARLATLSRNLHVNFAVDDFGVGHSSLDRISTLSLTQIKVDRSILHHALALKELELVVQLARTAMDRGHTAQPRVVVVEGFDAESPVRLSDIYNLGIRYVQGYITEEPASIDLLPLNLDLRERIAAFLR